MSDSLGYDNYLAACVQDQFEADELGDNPWDEGRAVQAADQTYYEYGVLIPDWSIGQVYDLGLIHEVVTLYRARQDSYTRDERDKLWFYVEEYVGPFTVVNWVECPPPAEPAKIDWDAFDPKDLEEMLF